MNKHTLFPLFVLSCLWQTSYASDINIEKLISCTKVASDTARLACFDAVTAQVSAQSETTQLSNEASPNSSETTNPESITPLPDDIGGGEFSSGNEEQEKGYRGHVTDCQQAADRRWFYIFDNGQVWKQVDRRKRRHRDCDFFVTLTEDNFGYTMVIDGQDSKIRVDRRR